MAPAEAHWHHAGVDGFGDTSGRFQVQAELGSGAIGVVYQARNLDTGEDVAVKVLRVAPTPKRLERFKREGAITARLRHPGIVRLLAAGTSEGSPYLEYELVRGANSLQSVLPLTGQHRALEILRDAARALGHAHATGVLHRDVKPDNVLIDVAGQVRISDFGIATAKGLESLTQTGELVGTPLYMAPEQIEGRRDDYSPATDVWALGVILYEILTRRLPFQGETLVHLVEAIRSANLEPPQRFVPEVSPDLQAQCLSALSLDPARRPATGTEFAEVLGAHLSAGAHVTPRRRSALRGAAALCVALVAAAGVGLYLSQTGPPPPPQPDSAEGPSTGTHTTPAEVSALGDAVRRGDPVATRALAERYLSGDGVTEDRARALKLFAQAADLGDLESMERLGLLVQEDPEAGEDALRGSVDWLRQAALSDRIEAMLALGQALFYGRGVEQNLTAARAWFEKAAQAGDLRGIRACADMLLYGRGGARDMERGVDLLRSAAERNDPRGIALLGECYELGFGVMLDHPRAVGLYERALALGDAFAMDRLGYSYQFGLGGLERDVDRALELYHQSAEAGWGDGMANLGFMHMKGWGVPQDSGEAVRWYERSADAGSTRGMVYLGFMYGEGLGVERSYATQERLYQQAANLGDASAMFQLGTFYGRGDGPEGSDYVRAVEWLQRAAELGQARAATVLGDFCSNGRGVPEDPVAARRWYRLALDCGDRQAGLLLGQLLLKGRGGPRDGAGAAALIENAAVAGVPDAARLLGEMLLKGDGVPVDEAAAVRWLERAAEQGNQRARELLQGMSR